MSDKQVTFCKCPLDCQEFCYILRQKREREQEEIRRFMPAYIQEMAQRIKDEEVNKQVNQPIQSQPYAIHPLHIAWAFVIVLALVFNQQLLDGITALSKLAK